MNRCDNFQCPFKGFTFRRNDAGFLTIVLSQKFVKVIEHPLAFVLALTHAHLSQLQASNRPFAFGDVGVKCSFTGLRDCPQKHFAVFRRQCPFAEGVNEAVFEDDCPNEGKFTLLRAFRGLRHCSAHAKHQNEQPNAKPHKSSPLVAI